MMKLTPRENFLNFYQNKPMERFPDFMLDINPVFSITGMDERSPNNENGKDWYGCDWVLDPGTQACVLDVSKPPLFEEIEDWREIVKFPDLDAIDWEANAKADGVDNFDPDKLNYLNDGNPETKSDLGPFCKPRLVYRSHTVPGGGVDRYPFSGVQAYGVWLCASRRYG